MSNGGYCKKLKRQVCYDKLKCGITGKRVNCLGPCCEHWDVVPHSKEKKG